MLLEDSENYKYFIINIFSKYLNPKVVSSVYYYYKTKLPGKLSIKSFLRHVNQRDNSNS